LGAKPSGKGRAGARRACAAKGKLLSQQRDLEAADVEQQHRQPLHHLRAQSLAVGPVRCAAAPLRCDCSSVRTDA
jgi:hypothetical protein